MNILVKRFFYKAVKVDFYKVIGFGFHQILDPAVSALISTDHRLFDVSGRSIRDWHLGHLVVDFCLIGGSAATGCGSGDESGRVRRPVYNPAAIQRAAQWVRIHQTSPPAGIQRDLGNSGSSG